MTIGATAGRYRIQGRIAVGGMGEVYLGSMSTFDGVEKAVALKVVRADLVADQELAHLFVEEAKVAMSLSHANIVQAFDVGRIDERWFLAMEHVDGMNLGTVLRACSKKLGQPIPQRFALFIAVEALKGLDYAHRRSGADGSPLGIVHRDISPANILVSYEGEVKIADFGIAKSALRGSRKSMSQSVKGKVPYMAPEQLRGASVDRRADLYSMGAVLYEMLVGSRMLPGSDDMALVPDVLAGRFVKPREASREVPEALEQIVLRAVALEPDARYPSAAAMRQELEAFAMTSGYLLSSNDVADFVRDVMRAEVPGSATKAQAEAATVRKGPPREEVGVRAQSAVPASEQVEPAAGAKGADDETAGGRDPFDAILGMELEKVDSLEPFSVFTSRSVAARREVTAPLVSETREVPKTRDAPNARVAVGARADEPEPTSTASHQVAGLRSSRTPVVAALAMAALAAIALAFVGFRAWGGAPTPPEASTELPGSAGSAPAASERIEREARAGAAPSPAPVGAPPQTPSGSSAPSGASSVAAPGPSIAPGRVATTKTRPRGHGTARPHRSDPPTSPTVAAAPTVSTPTAAPATVSINTDPWSYVTIDGELVRSTPLLGHRLTAGRHRVLLRNPSEHLERSLVLDLAPGENRRVSLDLHATP